MDSDPTGKASSGRHAVFIFAAAFGLAAISAYWSPYAYGDALAHYSGMAIGWLLFAFIGQEVAKRYFKKDDAYATRLAWVLLIVAYIASIPK